MTVDELVQIFRTRSGFEVVDHSATPKQVRLFGRVGKGAMKQWLLIVHRLLTLKDSADWSVDISKQYFLRSGQVMFGWRLIIQAEVVEDHLADVVQGVLGAPKLQAVVSEQPLVGTSIHRNTLSPGGKGAQSVISAVVGPAAIGRVGP